MTHSERVGSWTCGCGLLSVGPVWAVGFPSLEAECPYCHDTAEVLALMAEPPTESDS